ncbi:MAG TPA: alpha/beta hydrolase [Pseudonocardia sp.]|uniref:alpha/beta hydrolase n=1 Tax=Pseudonocardia sp. TaxID=60912 RepID=UPI002C9D3F34|nr:alpha/beta hydrolase [Pseudonocardia sp.]HTF46079.1 alpha/beta hydrolase [Pseudonocardia sp.]
MRGGSVPVLVGALGAAAVTGAYRPWLRRWPLSVPNALLSAIASEKPGVLVGAHALAGAAALRSPGASRVAGLALNAGALVGLVGLLGDARRSSEALDRALREAEVPETVSAALSAVSDGASAGLSAVSADVPAGRWAGLAGRARRRPEGVLAGRVARRRYRRVADISYSEHGPFGTLDVWHRADLPLDGRAPVLLQVHGGAWSTGDKVGQAEPLLGYFAERGWVCVTVNYRLAPVVRWPAMVVDVKRAIAWVREHIAGHGGDPDFIAITGGSAGGHLAALAALSANDPDYQPGFTEVDTSLAAAVPLYGVHDFTRDRQGLWPLLEGKIIGTSYAADEHTWRQASPALRVDATTPPFFVVHGSTDAIVGVEQSRRLVDALRAASPSPVGYAELPHAQHGFDAFASARTAYTVDAVYRFLTAVHQRAGGPAVVAGAGQTGRKQVDAGR